LLYLLAAKKTSLRIKKCKVRWSGILTGIERC
jgi:hypothetical protein